MTDLTSIGRIACAIQKPLASVRKAIAALGIEPALRLNGVDHYSRGDFERIDAYLRSDDRQPVNAKGE